MSDSKKPDDSERAGKNTESESNEDRRKRLKQILAGGGMFVGATTLQKEWTKPVIDSVILPVHAQPSALNGSYSTPINVFGVTDLLEYLIPQAHAGGLSFAVCINVVNGVANVQVIIESDWWLYTGSAALNFFMTMSPNQASGGNHDVSVTGAYDETANKINGAVTIDGGTPTSYEATPITGTCALDPPIDPPPPTTPR